ncbi:NAD(P)-binding protein [Hypoxylon crocopeplum]|nr:NAD(P)-binding protein [Hypoxylon crocopeplum]
MVFSKIQSFITQSWPPRPAFTDDDVPPNSQAGRVFVVTGGNSGIGFELCKLLLGSGATVYMASRSIPKQEKAEAAIASIVMEKEGQQGTGILKFLHLDLGDLASVKQAALSFSERETRLDVLWNNAGIGANGAKFGDHTTQGFEILLGTHCIGALFFTELLYPKLKAAADADADASSSESGPSGRTRVVWTSSALVDSAAPTDGIDFAALDTGLQDRMANYAMSKAGAWILGHEFARRHEEDGILAVVANPGNVKGGSYAGTPRALMAILNLTMLYKTIFGAYTQLYAGLSPELKWEHSGKYVVPWGRLWDHHVRQDMVKAMEIEEKGGLGYGKRFWEWCEGKSKPFI